MATPYSQIIGAQALENVISGRRYDNVTDEVIKYVLGYYGEPVIPIDQAVKGLIMTLPRTKKFIDWQPEEYLKSIDAFREELGPDLSDDELLLKIIIPGGPAKAKVQRRGPAAPQVNAKRSFVPLSDIPMEYSVDVDGETFTVKISPIDQQHNGAEREGQREARPKRTKEAVPGAVIPKVTGTLVSIRVEVGQVIEQGDLLATVEAMKMMRDLEAPHGGVVEAIFFDEGEMIQLDDVLMVVVPKDE
jgi:biotin carboxyl carrier protein